MNEFKQILINKNRGWRGLAEAIIYNDKREVQNKIIFSFSQNMWNDLIYKNLIVIQDKDNYYVVHFEDTGKLPRPDQQRSVLIKNYEASITEVNKYAKAEWASAPGPDWGAIGHFVKNKNNHTTSDWNCIGVRVTPSI